MRGLFVVPPRRCYCLRFPLLLTMTRATYSIIFLAVSAKVGCNDICSRVQLLSLIFACISTRTRNVSSHPDNWKLAKAHMTFEDSSSWNVVTWFSNIASFYWRAAHEYAMSRGMSFQAGFENVSRSLTVS